MLRIKCWEDGKRETRCFGYYDMFDSPHFPKNRPITLPEAVHLGPVPLAERNLHNYVKVKVRYVMEPNLKGELVKKVRIVPDIHIFSKLNLGVIIPAGRIIKNIPNNLARQDYDQNVHQMSPISDVLVCPESTKRKDKDQPNKKKDWDHQQCLPSTSGTQKEPKDKPSQFSKTTSPKDLSSSSPSTSSKPMSTNSVSQELTIPQSTEIGGEIEEEVEGGVKKPFVPIFANSKNIDSYSKKTYPKDPSSSSPSTSSKSMSTNRVSDELPNLNSTKFGVNYILESTSDGERVFIPNACLRLFLKLTDGHSDELIDCSPRVRDRMYRALSQIIEEENIGNREAKAKGIQLNRNSLLEAKDSRLNSANHNTM